MLDKYKNFLRGVSVNWYGKLGVILTSSSFITFIIFQFAMLLGLLTNAYIGLIIYLLFPALFIIGLILIPLGWFGYRKATGKTTSQLLNERFADDEKQPQIWGSKVFRIIIYLTAINILFMVGVSVRMLHFMDQPVFCGTACHSVMNPEWTTYQVSPHARVKCVECHVGEGVGALIDSKLNGMWQMISLTFNLYEQPIPTPVHQLRPARETCEKCHWPSKFYGTKLKTIARYANDSLSTPAYTTLGLKIDTGKGENRAGIHWHINPANEVRYLSIDDKREDMVWVETRNPDGIFHRYNNKTLDYYQPDKSEIRIFDCVDCHNRATHIYEYPNDAIDERIGLGLISRDIPFVARQAKAAILGNYSDQAIGIGEIENTVLRYYRKNFSRWAGSHSQALDSLVGVLQEIYTRNIHPGMNIGWGSYPNHISHRNSAGCFRCHNENLVDDSGKPISFDCTLCHSLLAYDSPYPFKYLNRPDTTEPDYQMHRYLGTEFLKSYSK